jgi:hypothetical protein
MIREVDTPGVTPFVESTTPDNRSPTRNFTCQDKARESHEFGILRRDTQFAAPNSTCGWLAFPVLGHCSGDRRITRLSVKLP